MKMDHNELAERLEKRLDKIEDKLDKHLETVSVNKADINWLRGSLKIGMTAFLTFVGGLVITAIKVFYK